MKCLIVLVAVLAIVAANPERERRSLGWGNNGAVIVGGVVPSWGGVALAGPVSPAAAVIGPVAGSAAVVGPSAGATAVVGPSAGSAVVAGPSGTVVSPGAGVLGVW